MSSLIVRIRYTEERSLATTRVFTRYSLLHLRNLFGITCFLCTLASCSPLACSRISYSRGNDYLPSTTRLFIVDNVGGIVGRR